MPRFFFDLHDRKGHHRDDDGVDCDDVEDARKQAQTLVADIIREQVPDGDLHEITCDVRGGAEAILYRVKVTLQGTMSPAGQAGLSIAGDPAS